MSESLVRTDFSIVEITQKMSLNKLIKMLGDSIGDM